MDFDLIVVGGGPVGAALVRAARGLSVALVAQERAAPAAARPGGDPRVYAISPANVAFLESLNAWQAIAPERRAPVYAMRVYGDGPGAQLEFDAYRAGVPQLAWIVEEGALREALWRALEGVPGLSIHAPARCAGLELLPEGARLRLGEGSELRAMLIAGADGVRSFVREHAGIAVEERAYGQSAVVANFACERAHRNVAYQWFQGGPVLALLPLPGEQVSMVWSTTAAHAEQLLRHDAASLCRELEAASRGVLGAFTLVCAPRAFELRRLKARQVVAPRLALLGDAAHVVHPLAGQGANLGLQDARELAAVLGARAPGRDPGDVRLLRRYARARAEPVFAMATLVDGLHGLFGARSDTLARLRNAGLNFVDRLPVLKNVLMRQAMG